MLVVIIIMVSLIVLLWVDSTLTYLLRIHIYMIKQPIGTTFTFTCVFDCLLFDVRF